MATLASTPSSTTYTLGSDTAGPFLVGYRIFSTDLLVFVDGAQRTDFTVSAVFIDGYSDAAEVTMDSVLSSGSVVTIESVTPWTREDDFFNGDPSLTRKMNIEEARQYAAIRDTRRDVARAVKTNPQQAGQGAFLPVGEAGRALIWDGTGLSLTNGPNAADIAAAQGFATDAEDAADRAEAAAAAAAASAQTVFLADLAALKADTNLTYTPAQPGTVVAGDTVQTLAEGYVYEVLASGAGSQDVQTAGSVKLNVRAQDGEVNLRAFDVDGTGATDTRAKFQRAVDRLSSGGVVIVPPGSYRIDSTVDLASEVTIRGQRNAIIQQGANNITIFGLTSLNRARLEGLLFRNAAGHTTGTPININGGFLNAVVNCDLRDMPSSNNGTVRLISTVLATVQGCYVGNSVGNGICVIGTGSERNNVIENDIVNCGGFGIFIAGTSSKNYIAGNRTLSNGLELIGVAVGSNQNTIVGNHAEGCGDNGISVTGNYNTVTGNICRDNDLSGIHLYGSFNTCTGNSCVRNGQNSASRAGIAVQPAFGGSGQNNLIVGNICDDDQAVPTQNNGIRVLASSYTAWASGQSITIGTFRTNGIRIYIALTAGTTGATAPTHTSGSASDGGVTWEYRNFFRTSAETRGNMMSGNKLGIHVSDDVLDQQDAELEPLEVIYGRVRFGSGLIRKRRVTEASTTVNADDHTIGVRSSSAWTITLPATTNLYVGREIIVQDETGQAGTNTITISGNGNNINGSATRTITTGYGKVSLYWTGVQWIAS